MRSAVPGSVLDVRAEATFAAGHAAGAVNIPLEQLAQRVYELPPKGSVIHLYSDDPDRRREAAAALGLRGYLVREASLVPADLRESGPSQARLWQPSPLLVEALEHIRPYAETGAPPLRALDVACGCGRNAVYLALHGCQVDAIDVLPDALAQARDLARRCGVCLHTVRQDLKRAAELPVGRYGVVTVLRFLHRPALPAIGQSVAPGGFIVYEAFHWRDPGRGRMPPRPGQGLRDGELAAAFAAFEPLIARDGVARQGRLFSQLLARRIP
jgi:SAM-dependent methyltransferase